MKRSALSLALLPALLSVHAAPVADPVAPTERVARALSPYENVGPLVLVDEGLPTVITLLEKITGKMALRSQDLPALKINFTSPGDLNRRQAEAALESLLALNGVAVIPEGADFLKVTILSKGPQSEAPPLYMDSVSGLPPSERVVARIFTLKNASVAVVEPLLQGIANKARGGTVVPLPADNALLMTDSLNNVQRAEVLVARLDTACDVVFIALKHTRATDIVKQLKALQGSGPKTAFAGDAGFEADETTNQVMVVTNARNADRVRMLVSKLDVENNARTQSAVITLRNIEAERVVKIIESLSKGGSGGSDTSDTGSLTKGRQAGNAANGGGGAPSGGAVSAPTFSQSGQGAKNASANPNDDEGDEGFSPKFSVVAETRTNSLVLFGTEADFHRVRDVVAKVDVKMPQVRIEAVIVEVTLGERDASGLQTLGIGYKSTGVSTASVNPGDVGFSTNTMSLPNGGSPPFTISGSLRNFSLEMLFNEAREDSRVRILSCPVIVTSHNRTANIKVGQKEPIITGTAINLQNAGATSSSVDYKDIGLELSVTPRIGSNGVVEMDVKQTIDNIVSTTIIDGNSQPIIGSREANSYLSAQSDEVVVLAGLQNFQETKIKGKLWLLGDIPLLGDWLFSPESTLIQKNELIIFLKPHVLTDADRVPAPNTPGLHPESPTAPDARDYISHGGFSELAKEHTVFETEDRERREKAAAEEKDSAR